MSANTPPKGFITIKGYIINIDKIVWYREAEYQRNLCWCKGTDFLFTNGETHWIQEISPAQVTEAINYALSY